MFSYLSAVVIDSDRPSRDAIEHCLKPFADKIKLLGAFLNFHEAMKVIPTGKPHIVIMEVKDIEQGVRDISFMASRFPGTTVVVTATHKNPDWILRLIRAGATEYLLKPVQAPDMLEVFKKLIASHAQANEVSRRGTVISVYNPCGGMGTTTIAVNLAVALAAQGKKTALLDLNFLNADITTFLDLTPRYTLTSIAGKLGQIDASFLRTILVAHSSGVHVLNGSAEIGEADGVEPERLQEVIVLLQGMFPYVIIDTGGHLPGCNLAVFAYSDHIIYNTVLHPPAISNATRYYSAMHDEGIGTDRLRLVINRYIPKDETKLADAERLLGAKAYQIVPNAYTEVKTAMCKGAPLAACYPRCQVVTALHDLANKLMLDGRRCLPEMQPGTDLNSVPAAAAPYRDTPLALVRFPGSG